MNGATTTLTVDDEIALEPSHRSAATLLFTDIVGSTSLLERLGDHAWLEVLRRHYALVRGHVARHGGAVVHVLGDGFMIAFDEVSAAVDCAVAMQRSLAAPDALLDAPLRVRMGIHSGPVIREPTDVHGRTVVLAARIGAHADAEEILVSEAVASSIMASGHRRLAERGHVAFKGLRGRNLIYSVEWRRQPPPVSARRARTARRDPHRRSRSRGARRLHAVSFRSPRLNDPSAHVLPSAPEPGGTAAQTGKRKRRASASSGAQLFSVGAVAAGGQAPANGPRGTV
jgi:class 3 adenylate cyclase